MKFGVYPVQMVGQKNHKFQQAQHKLLQVKYVLKGTISKLHHKSNSLNITFCPCQYHTSGLRLRSMLSNRSATCFVKYHFFIVQIFQIDIWLEGGAGACGGGAIGPWPPLRSPNFTLDIGLRNLSANDAQLAEKQGLAPPLARFLNTPWGRGGIKHPGEPEKKKMI